MNKIRNQSKKKRIPQRAYLCKCESWHLTSEPVLNEPTPLIIQMTDEISRLRKLNSELATIIKNLLRKK
jgi:hypothetical protein